MIVQSSKCKFQSFGTLLLIVFVLFTVCCLRPAQSTAGEKWQGVDESVVEKYAKEHGREAREPFINTDQGDLLLFVFLLGGTIAGFIAGYSWRKLTENRSEKTEDIRRITNTES